MSGSIPAEGIRLGNAEHNLNLFVVDFILFDYAHAHPEAYVLDRRGNEVTFDHLRIPPAYSRQSEYNPWGTYGTVTVRKLCLVLENLVKVPEHLFLQ
jgi:hypothetical protein